MTEIKIGKKMGFLFSGQGAQYSGMGGELAAINPAAKEVFAMAEVLRPGTAKQCFEGSKEELSQTENTQPCLFCVDLAAAAALKALGVYPQAVAGFSLGEVAALAFADALSYERAFALVCKRAEFMAEAARESSSTMMAVLKLPTAKVKEICEKYPEIYPVNFNCGEQVVVAGVVGGFADFGAEVKAAGGRVMPLPVSGGFHSPFMASAGEKMAEELAGYDFAKPKLPVYANLDGKAYGETAQGIRHNLHQQVINPVVWEDTIKNMVAAGIEVFVEVGAGKTLSNLVKKIEPQAICFNVENRDSLMATITGLQELV